ncbi:Glycosyl transferase UDP-N-acetylglucosamine, LPS N-acetylglucosamine transferase [Sulfitobacter noctilucae]|nr:Glycosyl transferase UDP-N-acetylglucosamine, LPS N-acetylglucosamine transferase [Sulfitobacter noctilucae]
MERPVRIFCARDDIFPQLRKNVTVQKLPSLFEPQGDEPEGAALLPTPDTTHCAPVGWSGIRMAMSSMVSFFAAEAPELMIVDVSAEVAQLARLCSVPHVKILQHGDRSDPGHQAAYDGSAGLLAPFHADLAQKDWHTWNDRTHFAPGLGVNVSMPTTQDARKKLKLSKRPMALIVCGGGGNGISEAALGVAARSYPEMDWITIGEVQRDWHATLPPNLCHRGWVDNAPDYIAAADLVISSTGNTTCAQVLTAAKPWIVVPEWRYFDEQVEKAGALGRAGAALHLPHMPGSSHAWRLAIDQAYQQHDPARQRALAGSADAASLTADWLLTLADRLWDRSDKSTFIKEVHHA